MRHVIDKLRLDSGKGIQSITRAGCKEEEEALAEINILDNYTIQREATNTAHARARWQ